MTNNKTDKPLTLDEVKKFTPEQIAEMVKIIDSWSGSKFREIHEDPEYTEIIDYALSHPSVKKIAYYGETIQSKPVATKFTPPVRSAEEIAIEGMSADQMKLKLLDPVKARGINNTLAAAARRAQ